MHSPELFVLLMSIPSEISILSYSNIFTYLFYTKFPLNKPEDKVYHLLQKQI